MSREIKFRAWDKRKEEMVYPSESQMDSMTLDLNNKHWAIFDSHLPIANRVCGSADDSGILMQYTGVRGFNGKDLYEGDIVEYLPISSSAVDTGYIVYYNDGFYVQSKSRMKRLYEEVFGTTRVIGNIYEHPHLLENK